MKQLKNILMITASFLLIAGCTGSGETTEGSSDPSDPGNPVNLDGDAATTSLAITAVSGSTQPLLKGAKSAEGQETDASIGTTDEAAGTITITTALVNIDRVDLKLPDEEDCDTLAFTLEDGDCGPSDDEEEDTLVGLLRNSEGSDEGEDDEGEDEEAEDEGDEDDDEGEGEDDEGEDDEGEADDDHIRIEGPFVFDMLTGTSTPSLMEVTLPSGTYRRIELRIHDLDEESALVEAGSPLLDHSMVFGGTYDDGESVRDFLIAMDFNEKVRFENESGFIVSEASDVNAVIISLNANDWFSGVDLGACLSSDNPETDENDVLVITEENDEGVCNFVDEMKQNVKNSGSIDREDDEDEEDEDGDENEDEDEGEDDEDEGGDESEDDED